MCLLREKKRAKWRKLCKEKKCKKKKFFFLKEGKGNEERKNDLNNIKYERRRNRR